MNGFLSIMRGCQDIMGTLVLGGVFERHPQLKVVCVEADAGWVPHYMYRMDHAYKRHRYWLPPGQALSKLPSEYFAENIYVTFQDDWVAFKVANLMNWKHLLWANDFPHSDSTWPWSQEMLAEHTKVLTPEQKRGILCDNVAELYGIDLRGLDGHRMRTRGLAPLVLLLLAGCVTSSDDDDQDKDRSKAEERAQKYCVSEAKSRGLRVENVGRIDEGREEANTR